VDSRAQTRASQLLRRHPVRHWPPGARAADHARRRARARYASWHLSESSSGGERSSASLPLDGGLSHGRAPSTIHAAASSSLSARDAERRLESLVPTDVLGVRDHAALARDVSKADEGKLSPKGGTLIRGPLWTERQTSWRCWTGCSGWPPSPWGPERTPSRTSRTLLVSAADVKGFCRYATPESRTPCWRTASSV